ncbi:hypothetical protein [Halobacterium litoreum]|uniref:Uncharacterized protein n=1 Tax=Halobacterium litoreum TaxID=2039234 RepID=A0ABD5NBH5_9EURY|nr:hypothetical protein [Halobacterium litoreum]UHH14563.1 hypothetical protein LT972_06070 [Halobacterium litoreum]
MGPRLSTRRDVLRAGSALAAAGAAGCIGAGPPIPGSDTGASYPAWIPRPRAIDEDTHGWFRYARPSDIAAYAAELEESYTRLRTLLPVEDTRLGLDFHDPDEFIGFGGAYNLVLTGAFDTAEIATRVGANGFSTHTTHRGYQIYERDPTNALGVTDDTIVVGRAGGVLDATNVVTQILDTGHSGDSRYVDSDESFATLTSRLGDAHFALGRRFAERTETDLRDGRFAGAVASGFRYEFGEDTTRGLSVTVFENAADIDVDDVEAYLEYNEDSGDFSDADDLSAYREGRTANVEWSVDTEAAFRTENQ